MTSRDRRDGVAVARGCLSALALAMVLVGLVLGATRPAFDGGTLLAMALVGLGGTALLRIVYGTRQ